MSFESKLWRINKIVLGLIVLVFLLSALLYGGYNAYMQLSGKKDTECSQKTNGCGKYGFNQECGILGFKMRYGNGSTENTAFGPGTFAYNSSQVQQYSDDGKVRWFCTIAEARKAGYTEYTQ